MELIVRHRGKDVEVTVERGADPGRSAYKVRIDGREYEVDAQSTSGGARSLLVSGRQFEVRVAAENGGRYTVHGPAGSDEVQVLDLLAHLAEESHGAGGERRRETVAAYMPGRVVTLLVDEGAEVTAGQGILVLEAMKMENEIAAERDGTVRAIHVEAGQAVESGDPLYELE